MDIVLVAGLWLPLEVWDETARHLSAAGHRPRPVALPGQGAEPQAATLEDQVEAVLAEVARCEQPLVVGHSAAATLAWLAADRAPEALAGTALIGGFPSTEGEQYAAFFPLEDGVMPFPGWEPFDGPDSADLGEEQRRLISRAAIPVPGGVATAEVRYQSEARHLVPAAVVCPEFSPAQARSWIENGDVPELARASSLQLIDIDSGHWPMVSAPKELARVLGEAAHGIDGESAHPAGGRGTTGR